MTNCSKKKCKLSSDITTFVDNLVTKEVTEYSYDNYLVKQLTLVVCAMKSFSKFFHHIYQNNIDQSVYDGDFEENLV